MYSDHGFASPNFSQILTTFLLIHADFIQLSLEKKTPKRQRNKIIKFKKKTQRKVKKNTHGNMIKNKIYKNVKLQTIIFEERNKKKKMSKQCTLRKKKNCPNIPLSSFLCVCLVSWFLFIYFVGFFCYCCCQAWVNP